MLEDIVNTMHNGDRPRLVELGKIKIGGLGDSRPTRSGGTFRLPRKDDHFSITTMVRDSNGDLQLDHAAMDELTKEYGDDDGKLRRIPICVLSNDIEDILQSAYVWYGGKVCWARSDGKETTWFYDPRKRVRLDEPQVKPFDPKILDLADEKGNRLFKLHTSFNCVLSTKQARWGGVYRFRTTSRISFEQLYSSLVHLSQLTGGVLVGMPLMLAMRPKQVAPDGKATTVYVVHVELMGGELSEIQVRAMQQAKFMLEFKDRMERTQRQLRGLLPAPGDEAPDEAEKIAEEFHPEAAEPVPAPPRYSILDDSPPQSHPPSVEPLSPPAAPVSQSPDNPGDEVDGIAEAEASGEHQEPEQPETSSGVPDVIPAYWIEDLAVMSKPDDLRLGEAKQQLREFVKLRGGAGKTFEAQWSGMDRDKQLIVVGLLRDKQFPWKVNRQVEQVGAAQ